MSDEITFLEVDNLRSFVKDVCITLGVPDKDANICSDVMITADLRGIESHGIQRLKRFYYTPLIEKRQSPTTNIIIEKETPTTARLDAGHGMGQVASYYAMEMAIKKAKEYGSSAIAVGNSTHFGIAGYYPLMAVKQNLIGFSTTNTRPLTAPTHGTEPMLGTNPLAIGIPTDDPIPFLIDCATSIIPQGKVEVYSRTKTPLPEGWVINKEGNVVTDSVQIIDDLLTNKAALLTLGGIGEQYGGHKGYGYSTAVEILSAALAGGPFMKGLTDDKGHKVGHFFMVVDPESFIELDIFKKIAGEICRSLRASKKSPGHDRIYTAGEKEYYLEIERNKNGIPINKSVLEDLIFINTELKLNYSFSGK